MYLITATNFNRAWSGKPGSTPYDNYFFIINDQKEVEKIVWSLNYQTSTIIFNGRSFSYGIKKLMSIRSMYGVLLILAMLYFENETIEILFPFEAEKEIRTTQKSLSKESIISTNTITFNSEPQLYESMFQLIDKIENPRKYNN